jgi:hypothetical protein
LLIYRPQCYSSWLILVSVLGTCVLCDGWMSINFVKVAETEYYVWKKTENYDQKAINKMYSKEYVLQL